MSTVTIPVFKWGAIYGYALVDADVDDQLGLSSRRWCCVDGYAFNNTLRYMHRAILGLERGEQRFVHHVDEDKLNNRCVNLQVYESRADANRAPHPKRDARCALSADEREVAA